MLHLVFQLLISFELLENRLHNGEHHGGRCCVADPHRQEECSNHEAEHQTVETQINPSECR